jgi:hypothetical protein
MTDDSELSAVLSVMVALEPLDERKWDYLDLGRRTFDAEGLLAQPLSSGERVLVEVAASLWDTGKVDLGYVARAMGGRHFHAIIDALAVRAGHGFTSTPEAAIERALASTHGHDGQPHDASRHGARAQGRDRTDRRGERTRGVFER